MDNLSTEVQQKLAKLKQFQEFYQREDGKYIFQKKRSDSIQLGIIFVASMGIFVGQAHFMYEKYHGKY